MSGLEIIGGITACQELLSSIAKLVIRLAGAKDEVRRTALKIENDRIFLSRFLASFKRVVGNLPDESRDHYNAVIASLSEDLERLEQKMSRYLSARTSFAVAKWSVWGGSVQAAEAAVHGWCERLLLQIGMLPTPSNLKRDWMETLDVSSLGPESSQTTAAIRVIKSQTEMTSLVERFRRVGVDTAANAGARLQISVHRLSKTRGPRRLTSQYVLDNDRKVEVDAIRIPGSAKRARVRWEVEKLTAVLAKARPEMHLLRAEGFCEDPNRISVPFGIVFALPASFEYTDRLSTLVRGGPGNLRSHKERPRHSLSQRVKLARDIVTAVLFVHSVGWVHKSIRTSNIVVAWDGDYTGRPMQDEAAITNPSVFKSAFLVGFSYARRQTRETQVRHYYDWTTKIYQHPSRLYPDSRNERDPDSRNETAEISLTRRTKHSVVHDIYSVGVVLLEIGLWRPHEADRFFEKTSPREWKRHFEKTAKRELPRAMGDSYASIVSKCIEGGQGDLAPILDELMALSI